MVESGDVAAMGPGPTALYVVLKAYTNHHDGRTFPSIKTMCEKVGLGKETVLKHLRTLEKHGYVLRESGKLQGRSTRYTLREKVVIKGDDEKDPPAAIATWDYVPRTVQAAVGEIRNLALKGDFEGVKIINIERLNINVENAALGQTVEQFNITLSGVKDPELRRQLLDSFHRRTAGLGPDETLT